jgi:hypothetical protein
MNSPCRDLWVAVLQRALCDLFVGSQHAAHAALFSEKIKRGESRTAQYSARSAQRDADRLQASAIAWFQSPIYKDDFELCCTFAGIDPTWFRGLAGRMISAKTQDAKEESSMVTAACAVVAQRAQMADPFDPLEVADQ